MRRRQLMAQAKSGAPNRLLTLTIRPQAGATPADRLRMLSHAWRVIVHRLRRRFPGDSIDYLAIVEATKAGEPHLHILLRSPFIPQSLLSSWMAELADSPIVDIRKIKDSSKVVSYVAKYVTKQPAQFEGSKRYWQTRGYQLDDGYVKPEPDPAAPPWRIDRRSVMEIVHEWIFEGYAPRSDGERTIIAFPLAMAAAPPTGGYQRARFDNPSPELRGRQTTLPFA